MSAKTLLQAKSNLILCIHRPSQVLILNRRIQKQNNSPEQFPNFIRDGFNIKVLAPGYSVTPEG